jgi:hypothetical protein
MKKKLSFVVKLQRPVCRTPIKPVQKHKSDVKYSRKAKYVNKLFNTEKKHEFI